MQYRSLFNGADRGTIVMRSSIGSTRDIDRKGCVSGRRANAPLRQLIIVVTAIVMASLRTEAVLARDAHCTSGHHSARGRYHEACDHAAMVRKGQRTAAVMRPYDFPNSYVLHGPRF
jgi:hypothetical protein